MTDTIKGFETSTHNLFHGETYSALCGRHLHTINHLRVESEAKQTVHYHRVCELCTNNIIRSLSPSFFFLMLLFGPVCV